MSGRGGKQVNTGRFARGTKARDERDAIWRKKYYENGWYRKKEKKKREEEKYSYNPPPDYFAQYDFSPEGKEMIERMLKNRAYKFPEWKEESGVRLWNHIKGLLSEGDERAKEFERELRTKFDFPDNDKLHGAPSVDVEEEEDNWKV